MTKNNPRNTSKRHAHIQTMIKIPANPAEIVGGDAFTRFCDGRTDRLTDGQTDAWVKHYVSPTLTEGDIHAPKQIYLQK